MRKFAWAGGLVLGIGLMLCGQKAWGVITSPLPLKRVLQEEQFIFTAKVESLDTGKPAMILTVEEDLKGKSPFRRLPIGLKGDSEAEKAKDTPKMLKRLAPKESLIVFLSLRGKRYIAFGYTNGTWFQCVGVADGEDKVRLAFTHCEPYLRQTFKGTTAELKQVVADSLSGKKEPPEHNPKEPPGLGPELKPNEQPKPEESGRLPMTDGPVFAVIPVLIGGPLAILGMLFPAVFGGATGQLRRWKAVLAVISFNSTVLFVQDQLSGPLEGNWWGTQAALWLIMTVATLLGLLWAWRRQLAPVTAADGNGATEQAPAAPGRGEVITLWVLSLAGVALVAFCLVNRNSLLDFPWKPLVALWCGVWAGTLYVHYVRWAAVQRPRAYVPTEGVMLWGMLLAFVGFGSTTLARGPGLHAAETGEGAKEAHGATFKGVSWTFTAPEKGRIESSPLVTGDRIYVAAAHEVGFTRSGAVYCLDRATGRALWSFDNEGDMKQVFSTPCLAGGRLYIGEGYHQDRSCKLYCLGADDGKKVWEFQTESHTESSPTVANGRVYCGAGDDGLYCLDAATGKESWRFPGLHVDASPVVHGDRVYAGSGVGDEQKSTAIFCLDAATGKEVWRVATDLPVWGSPAVAGKQAFFGLGNGNLVESDAKPAGALLCVDAETGKEIWRCKADDGVLVRPVVDGRHVYFGSRDKHCYCVSRKTGAVVWRKRLDSPMVAAAAVARCPDCGHTTAVYAVSSAGRIYCLDPKDGMDHWYHDLAEQTRKQPRLLSTPAVTVSHDANGEHRRIYLGAGLQSNLTWTASLYCLEDQAEE